MTIRTILAALLFVTLVAACTTTEPPTTETNTLTVVKAGTGTGEVTSSPAGINGSLSAEFEVDEVVTLTATADDFSVFDGFTGYACEGVTADNVCVITMSADRTVTATFNAEAGEGTLVTVEASGTNTAEEFLAPSNQPPDGATKYPTGWTYAESSDLELPYDSTHNVQLVGLRFANVQIPSGATIVSAVVRFTALAGGTGSPALTIAGQASTTPAAFPLRDADGAPSSDISSRALTTADVDWTITEPWVAGTVYTSADLTDIVQEIVDLGGWDTGSAIAIIIAPQDEASVAFRRASNSATLAVRYTTP